MTEFDATKTLRRLLPNVSQRGLAASLDENAQITALPGYGELAEEQQQEARSAAFVASVGRGVNPPPKATIYSRIRRADTALKKEAASYGV